MAVEPKRGCGYRKIGGLYLVSGPGGVSCDRLPFPLDVCPTCHHGFKQARSWTWIDLKALVGGFHAVCSDLSQVSCPMCLPVKELAGLLWVGEKFYHTTREFNNEAAVLGISRRIKAIPRGFELGQTWILLAHPKAIWEYSSDPNVEENRPGIFKIWRPSHLEKILPASKRDSEEAADLTVKGITCVFVPDDDPDHQASGYENGTDDQLELINEEAAVHRSV